GTRQDVPVADAVGRHPYHQVQAVGALGEVQRGLVGVGVVDQPAPGRRGVVLAYPGVGPAGEGQAGGEIGGGGAQAQRGRVEYHRRAAVDLQRQLAGGVEPDRRGDRPADRRRELPLPRRRGESRRGGEQGRDGGDPGDPRTRSHRPPRPGYIRGAPAWRAQNRPFHTGDVYGYIRPTETPGRPTERGPGTRLAGWLTRRRV